MTVDKIQLYKATDGWRWCYIASNGPTLADSGQGYSRRHDAKRGAARVCGVTDLEVGVNRLDAAIAVLLEVVTR